MINVLAIGYKFFNYLKNLTFLLASSDIIIRLKSWAPWHSLID